MIDIRYIAGFWDGEGTINIHRQKIKNSDKMQHFLYVKVSNTNKEILEKIKKFFGRGIITSNGIPVKGHRKAWQYQASCNNAYKVIEILYPYLIVKKEQAELAMQFQERMNIKKKRCMRYSKDITSGERKYRENVRVTISNLNKGKGLIECNGFTEKR